MSVRSATALTVATATAVVLAAQPAQPAQPTQPAQPVQRAQPVRSAPAAPAAPAPADRPVSELLTELSTLYRQTETAAAAYHSAGERLTAQRNRTRKLNSQLARTRGTVDRNRAEAGRLARSQYRNGAAVLPPGAALLLADDPVQALANAHSLERAVGNQARTVKRLTSVERREHALAAKARRALERQQRLATGRKAHRDRAQTRLRQVEKLLSSLPADRLAQLRQLERTRTERSQAALLAEGTLGGPADATRTPTPQGERALSYALAQRGKPYRWGAAGPRAYDCSGLTVRAWEQAGVRIPRSSQRQWQQLERVPLRELRPGDLVVYFARATHVAVYAGHGKVVHAPRPGSRVTLAPIAIHPIRGAVRPS